MSAIHGQAPFGISCKNQDRRKMPIVFFGQDFSDPPSSIPKVAFSKLRHNLCSRDRLQLGVGSCAHCVHTPLFKKPDPGCILFRERVDGNLNTNSIDSKSLTTESQPGLCGCAYLTERRQCHFRYSFETMSNVPYFSLKGGLPMKPIKVQHKLTYWQRVFLQSKVNGASYNGESLPGQVWCWPKNTYLQSRLQNQQELGESIPPVRQKVVIEAGNNRAH